MRATSFYENEVKITHRVFSISGSARQPSLPGGIACMDRIAQEETKAHLMETNEDFRQLAGRHSQLSRQLDELMSRAHLSEQEHVEEVRLKKLKLRLKDQMEAMMSQYRTQPAA
jgi:uncharacterized protein YdcH (DUF465 family)